MTAYEQVRADDGVFDAYRADPARTPAPGIVLLQEIFGINDNIRGLADRLAEAGYVVLTPDMLWRIEQGTLDGLHPGAIVVMIGVNNLGGGFSVADTVSGVRAVVSRAQEKLPQVPILLLAILPARQSASDPLREKIRQANGLIASLAQPGRVYFHDVGSVLLEPDGTISEQTMRDFLHPTASGYERLTAAVAPLLAELMPAAAPSTP